MSGLQKYEVSNTSKANQFLYNAQSKIVGIAPGQTKTVVLDSAVAPSIAKRFRGSLTIGKGEEATPQDMGAPASAVTELDAGQLLAAEEAGEVKGQDFKDRARALLGDDYPKKDRLIDIRKALEEKAAA